MTSPSFMKMAGWIKVVFGIEASLALTYTVFKGSWIPPKIKYFPLERYPNLWT